jgi:RluA family pseudouridine synthase
MSEAETVHPRNVLAWLLERYPGEKRVNLERFIRERRVTVNGVAADHLKLPLVPGDKVELRAGTSAPAPREPRASVDEAMPLASWVVFEDDDILVLNKPAGVLTSSGPGDKRPTLWNSLKAIKRKREPAARMGLIHRLDRDATGLLVFSKNDAAYQALKAQFFKHSVERIYRAVVTKAPKPAEGRRISRLLERADGTVYSTTKAGKGELAVTDYRVVLRGERRALVQVKLHTGRKHQIRVHLSEMGSAILGDSVYGRGEPGEELMLQASHLSLTHPASAQWMQFEAPPTPGMRAAAAEMKEVAFSAWDVIEAASPRVNWPDRRPQPEPPQE